MRTVSPRPHRGRLQKKSSGATLFGRSCGDTRITARGTGADAKSRRGYRPITRNARSPRPRASGVSVIGADGGSGARHARGLADGVLAAGFLASARLARLLVVLVG